MPKILGKWHTFSKNRQTFQINIPHHIVSLTTSNHLTYGSCHVAAAGAKTETIYSAQHKHRAAQYWVLLLWPWFQKTPAGTKLEESRATTQPTSTTKGNSSKTRVQQLEDSVGMNLSYCWLLYPVLINSRTLVHKKPSKSKTWRV